MFVKVERTGKNNEQNISLYECDEVHITRHNIENGWLMNMDGPGTKSLEVLVRITDADFSVSVYMMGSNGRTVDSYYLEHPKSPTEVSTYAESTS